MRKLILTKSKHSIFFILSLWAVISRCHGQELISETFENGQFNPRWSLTTGVVIKTDGGANGSSSYAVLSAYSATSGRELGARFDSISVDGATDFYIDFYFRVRNTTQRQFNLHISDSTGAISSSAATINLRAQSDGWAVYSANGWQTISVLPAITASQWYRLKLIGRNWGKSGACYDIALSNAGETNFIAIATNLNWFQNGNPSNNTARYFVFTTVYGNNPGFDVDEITAAITATPGVESNAVIRISGVYPHLAVFSSAGEIGIGAVVPWADKLWFITYPPHAPNGSSDKLWMLDTNLTLTAHPLSVGGTHANRMIHRETQQLNIGPYFISSNGTVRVISPSVMPGRLTGSARHLSDPQNKLYIATMEEGLYEVDVNSLAVTELFHDMNSTPSGVQKAASLPGNHGKGLYTSQGKLFYSNNGSGGCLAAYDGNSWSVIKTNKFTELTGPGGIYGNNLNDDRLWSSGWDSRSIILKLFQNGNWFTFRLPKASYTHDADHGWYTEWPRIREVTDGKLLMHMHGMFYFFPKSFSSESTSGIEPICAYLKMPVDYCWWNNQLVMGRDDASTTGGNIWAGQSHSALWFGSFHDMKLWGPPSGFGGVWVNDAVTANTPSAPFLLTGFQNRILHLRNGSDISLTLNLQYDNIGNGNWQNYTNINLPAQSYLWHIFPSVLNIVWLRIVPDKSAPNITAYFHLSNPPHKPNRALFEGIADITRTNSLSDGIIRPKEGDARVLQFAANIYNSAGELRTTGYYEIGGSFQLRKTTNATAETTLRTTYSLSNAAFTVDEASVIYVKGTNRFRLPKGSLLYDRAFPTGFPRAIREVVTERQLFNAHGTIYELPLDASGGFRRIKPITTHNKRIMDFATWRGLLVITGISDGIINTNHIFRSDDNRVGLWFGEVDDLWQMGPPSGVGGVWKDTPVTAGVPSDPFLMFGYEHKVLELSHKSDKPVTFTIEVDFLADNVWSEYARFVVQPGQILRHIFPNGYSAHWIRLKTDVDTVATAIFTYTPEPLKTTGIYPISGGAYRVVFSGPESRHFSLLASDNLKDPISMWTTLTNGYFDNSTIYFDDFEAVRFNQRFYIVRIQ